MSVKLLTEHRLEFVSLKGGCTGSSESTLVKMQICVTGQGFEPMCTIRWVHSYLREGKIQTITTNLVFHASSAPFHARVH